MAIEVFACVVGRKAVPRNRMFNLTPESDEIELIYPFWVIREHSNVVLIDVGFSRQTAEERGIQDYRPPMELLRRLGIEPDSITTAIISHLHWDHFHDPVQMSNCQFVVQRDDVEYFTGRGATHPAAAVCDPKSLDTLNRLRGEGRLLELEGGITSLAGLTLVHVGGHTPGSQVVVIDRPGSPVVLACDASHFYDNVRTRTPSSMIHSYESYQRGFHTIETLALGGLWFPGHDPAMLDVMERVEAGIYRL